MSLYTNYVSALRNIRGVVGFKPDEDISAELDWLEAKFKYRDIGVGSAQLSVVPDSTMRQRFKQRPLVLLPPPSMNRLINSSSDGAFQNARIVERNPLPSEGF